MRFTTSPLDLTLCLVSNSWCLNVKTWTLCEEHYLLYFLFNIWFSLFLLLFSIEWKIFTLLKRMFIFLPFLHSLQVHVIIQQISIIPCNTFEKRRQREEQQTNKSFCCAQLTSSTYKLFSLERQFFCKSDCLSVCNTIK